MLLGSAPINHVTNEWTLWHRRRVVFIPVRYRCCLEKKLFTCDRYTPSVENVWSETETDVKMFNGSDVS